MRYRLSKAEENVVIWNDRAQYRFSNLPSYLDGAIFAQVPHKQIPRGTVIEIIVNKPSTIYIVFEDSARTGGFKHSLPNEGWTIVSDNANIWKNGNSAWTFKQQIWKKVLTNTDNFTLILPATTTHETVHSLFFQGNFKNSKTDHS